MIHVRIRYASEVNARLLCKWDASELDTLIPTIQAWGIAGQDPDVELTGQFQVEPGMAYFEVVIQDLEDT